MTTLLDLIATLLPGICLVLVVLIILGCTLLVRRARRHRGLVSEPSRRSAQLVGSRRSAGWRWTGLGLGVVAAVQTASVGSLGLGLMRAPTVFGLCVIGGVVLGELATTPRHDGVRTATLETRTVGKYLPRRPGGLVAVCTLTLGALLVATTLMGSADSAGRPGRSLERRCSPAIGHTSGPWPGLYYSVPLAIAVAVCVLVAFVALRAVVLRPRRGASPELVAADEVLRRRSAEAVVAATGVMVATSLLGIALAAASKLIGFPCAPAWWAVLGFGLLAVAALSFLLAAWCLAQLLAGPGVSPVAPAARVHERDRARL